MRLTRRRAAVLTVALSLLSVFAWDELGMLYEVGSIHGRLAVYALLMLAGWLAGTQFLSEDGTIKRFTEATIPSWFVPMAGASYFVGAFEQLVGIHWSMDGLAVFGHHSLVYVAGTVTAFILRYKRTPRAASGT